jgi:hypothetical protein
VGEYLPPPNYSGLIGRIIRYFYVVSRVILLSCNHDDGLKSVLHGSQSLKLYPLL